MQTVSKRQKICKGNHDTIPTRQAATVGMGERYLKNHERVAKSFPKHGKSAKNLSLTMFCTSMELTATAKTEH